MNQNQSKLFTWIGGVLIVALVSLSILPAPENEEDEKWTTIGAVAIDDIQAVEIKYSGESYNFIYDDTGFVWSGHETPLNQSAVNSLFEELFSLECGETLPGEAKEYGLEDPAWEFLFTLNEAQMSISIGDQTRVGSHHYMNCDALDGVRLSRYSVELPTDILELLDKRLLDFQPSMVDGFMLQNGQSLERSGNEWVFTSPINARANSEGIDDWLSKLSVVSGKSFANQEFPLEEIELNTIRMTLGDDTKRLSWYKNYGFTINGDVFELSQASLQLLDIPISNLLSTSFLNRSEPPISIRLELGDISRVIQYESEKWSDDGRWWTELQLLEVNREARIWPGDDGVLELNYEDSQSESWRISSQMPNGTRYLKTISETVVLEVPGAWLSELLSM